MRENFFLRDAGLPTVGPEDGRRVEVVVTGLSLEQGVPLALDATVFSCTHADGRPFPGATADRRSTFAPLLAAFVSKHEAQVPDIHHHNA